MSVLQALRDAIEAVRSNDQELLRNALDMTSYYDNIRHKVRDLDPSLGSCYELGDNLPGRICSTSMKGRTQYTPRAHAEETSVTSIIKPAIKGYLPVNTLKPLYKGPDAHNPCYDLPERAIDVVKRIAEVANSTTRSRHLGASTVVTAADREKWDNSSSVADTKPYPSVNGSTTNPTIMDMFDADGALPVVSDAANETVAIIPGIGWQIIDEPQGICDGSYDSICAKSTRNRCVLYGHHDERGAVLGSELSGWLVLQIPREEVVQGIIILKLHTWYRSADNSRTKGWTEVNNVSAAKYAAKYEEEVRQTSFENRTNHRRLERHLSEQSYETPPLGKWFEFEYAIDGSVTTLSRESFLKEKKDIHRVVEVLTLLDDETFYTTHQSSSNTIEVAIRMKGCLRQCVFGVTHLYWA